MPMLIIDETHADIFVTSASLEPFDTCGTVAFEDAGTALTWCASNKPRLVVLDFNLAHRNGVDFLRYMHALPTCRSVPVIVLTTEDPQKVAWLLQGSDIAAILKKPLDQTAFATQVKVALTTHAHAAPALPWV